MKPHGLLLGFTLLICGITQLRVPDVVLLPDPKPKSTPRPPEPEVAPPGRYWLRVQKSFTTDDGVVGFAPGTGLTATGETEYLTDSGDFLTLKEPEVTNDLPEARQLVGYKAAARASHARLLATADAAAKAADEERAAQREEAERTVAAKARIASRGGEARPVATDYVGSIGRVGDTHSVVRSPSWRLHYPYWIDSYGRRHYYSY